MDEHSVKIPQKEILRLKKFKTLMSYIHKENPFITASLKVRAIRRYRELRKLGKKTTLKDVKKSIKTRDYSDYNRRISPLKKTKDSILINTSNLTKNACFLKIKNIIEKETKN